MPGPVSRRAFLTNPAAKPRPVAVDAGPGEALVAVLGGGCISLHGTACRLCGDPCEPDAIRFRPLVGGRSLPEISAETCTGCGVCALACPVGALSMTPRQQA